jgi:signal transduction histidine kinase
MRRAAIFLYDTGLRRVRAVGAHGTSFEQLAALQITLADVPLAQRALAQDRVMLASDRIEREVPAEYARLLGITTLVCSPLLAAERPYGVIMADRGAGTTFDLSDGERHLLWTLGKIAALALTARIATAQQERARQLDDRLMLARDVHDRVVQRLFGVSLALAAEQPLDRPARERARSELTQALAELRTTLERSPAKRAGAPERTLRDELDRLVAEPGALPIELDWPDGVAVPPALEGVAQDVLAEALRNASKHAVPRRVVVAVARDAETFRLEVRNDGPRPAGGGGGMGLRLAGLEALRHGGFVEFGPCAGEQGEEAWRVRLIVPAVEDR